MIRVTGGIVAQLFWSKSAAIAIGSSVNYTLYRCMVAVWAHLKCASSSTHIPWGDEETRVIRGPVGENNCSLAWRKSKKGTDGCLLASCGWPGLSLWISGYAIPTAPSLSSLPSFDFLLQFLNFKRLIFTLLILSLPL